MNFQIFMYLTIVYGNVSSPCIMPINHPYYNDIFQQMCFLIYVLYNIKYAYQQISLEYTFLSIAFTYIV